MSKLVARGYITEVVTLTLKSFFSVPKGTYDIRVVFDATVSGLNDYIWAPKFMLPPMGSLLMMVSPKKPIFHLDVREMFYKFRLSSVFANYYGVDLGSYLGHKRMTVKEHLSGCAGYASLWVWCCILNFSLRDCYGRVRWRGETGVNPVTHSGGTRLG